MLIDARIENQCRQGGAAALATARPDAECAGNEEAAWDHKRATQRKKAWGKGIDHDFLLPIAPS
jgi:hypothetical protein